MYTEIAWRESIEARVAELRAAGAQTFPRRVHRARVSETVAVFLRRGAERLEARAASHQTCLQAPRLSR
jgi:hypothetical protein